MKRPCFDYWERLAIKEGDSLTNDRYKIVKAGRNLEKHLKKDLDKLFSPVINCISKIITNLTPKSSHNEKI